MAQVPTDGLQAIGRADGVRAGEQWLGVRALQGGPHAQRHARRLLPHDGTLCSAVLEIVWLMTLLRVNQNKVISYTIAI